MKEFFVFDEDGRFTGKVVTTISDRRRAQKELKVTSNNVLLRYNVLLEAFRGHEMVTHFGCRK